MVSIPKKERLQFSVKQTDKVIISKKNFPVVAIGASAGALSSFEKFFSTVPLDSGIAFIIIMHLYPHYKSQLAEVIQRYTNLPVTEAVDGVIISPNQVYLIPPNKDMGIHNLQLLLLTPSKSNGLRQPIDYFLQSLADDQWERAVAIIFSGMGSDGETGIRMIKEKLGMTMVQNPQTAEYDSMPLAAIGTNSVDFILPPEEMPSRLIQYLNHPVLNDETSEERLTRNEVNAIQKILMLLRSQTGNDFSQYKKSTITRRIGRRIAYLQLIDFDSYVIFLQNNPSETHILFNQLLIGVTKFFRDKEAFDSLGNKLQELIASKKDQEPLRVWVAGCSTGEEAYSVAMMVIEYCDLVTLKLNIQIYATDLDQAAIDHARSGFYHGNIAADVSPERLERFFVKKGEGYQVKKGLRDVIVFAQQNIVKDAPFIRLDMLCCRNMLIYFTADLQKKIIPLFYYTLNPKGIMFLGPAETIGGFTDLFTIADAKWKLFERRTGQMQLSKFVDFSTLINKPAGIIMTEDKNTPVKDKSIVNIFNKTLIDYFTPAAVLVDETGNILYSNGKTGKYLELPSGEARMNIHRMAKDELKYPIASCIDQSLLENGTVHVNGVNLKIGVQTNRVNIIATVVRENNASHHLVLIVFEDAGKVRKNKSADAVNVNAVENLEKELIYTRQRLNDTIEKMQTSLEDLKLANEELQSTNEELQSTNEEALTTKEEMQSLNEELMTINTQYHQKEEELVRLSDDMKNLLDSTEIGTLFLDNQLAILRYTPQVRKLFNFIPTDVGRPFSHVVTNFELPIDDNIIKEVIEKLSIREIDIRAKNLDWYRVRIMPYRTLDNYISGAVLTFTLITDYKQMQSRLTVLQEYSAGLLANMPEPTAQLDAGLIITKINKAFETLFNTKAEIIIGKKISHFIKERWALEIEDVALNKCIETGKTESIVALPSLNNNRGYKLVMQPFTETTNTTTLIVMTINER